MDIQLGRDSPIALGDQLQAQIRLRILSGELAPHDLLPTVQALAEATGTNYNTVAAAYRALEKQGFLVQRRRAGTRVAAEPPLSAEDMLAVQLSAEVSERMCVLGLPADETLQLIGAQLATHRAEAAPHIAVLAADVTQAASLAGRAEALFGKKWTFVPLTLASYRSQNYVATLVAPALLEALQVPSKPPSYTPVWPNTYDFPAGAD